MNAATKKVAAGIGGEDDEQAAIDLVCSLLGFWKRVSCRSEQQRCVACRWSSCIAGDSRCI